MKPEINKALAWIKEADTILVLASNGLSISEGYHIFADNDDFKKYFGEFRDKYGIDSIISGVFAHLPTVEQERFMQLVRKYMIEDYVPSESMKNLLTLLEDKDYYILTSNADTHFQLSGFDNYRLFEIEGNFAGMKMYSDRWYEQKARYDKFIFKHVKDNILVLEFGVGKMNQMIKKPTMSMIEVNRKWKYITFNFPQEIQIPTSIMERSMAVCGDVAYTLEELVKENKRHDIV